MSKFNFTEKLGQAAQWFVKTMAEEQRENANRCSFNYKMKLYLQHEGYHPHVSEDSEHISFKKEGATFVYFGHKEEEHFFSLALPYIEEATPATRSLVLEAANRTCQQIRVGKVIVTEDQVWCVYERFLTSMDSLEEICPRALDVLIAARRAFYLNLEQLSNNQKE